MKPRTFNELTVMIPEGWEDATVVTLVGPALPSAAPLAGRRPGAERPSIVLRRIHAADEGFASAQEAAMALALVDFKVLERGEVALGAAPAIRRELAFGPSVDRVRQVHLYFQRGDRFYAVVGTGTDDLTFAAIRKAAVEIAKSVTNTAQAITSD